MTPTYNYQKRLVERITGARQALNDTFDYYGHKVILQSCMRGFVVVMVYRTTEPTDGELVTYTFDFYTKKLHVEESVDLSLTNAIVEAFDEIYPKVKVIYPLPKKQAA